MLNNTFVASVAERAPLGLGQGLWLVSSERGVEVPALSLATADTRLEEAGEPVTGVFCLAAQGDAHRGQLERILALLDTGSARELHGLDA